MAPRSKRQRTANGSTKTPTVETVKEEVTAPAVVEESSSNYVSQPVQPKGEEIKESGHQDLESYPDYVKRRKVLILNKERRLAEADRNRRLQIQNITDLYEFELEDIEAKLETDLALLRQDMQEQLQEERRAAQAAIAAAAATAGPAGGTGRMTTRTLTSSIPSDEGGTEEGGGAKVSSSTAASAAAHKKSSNGSSKVYSQHIDKILSEENVREDFIDIVRDLEDRAISYTKKHLNGTVLEVESDGSGSLVVRSKLRRASTVDQQTGSSSTGEAEAAEVYRAGCMVSIRSSNSDDDLAGVVVVVGDDDLIVKLHSGPRVRIPFSQLRDRRVTISRDADSYRDMALILASRQTTEQC